MINLGELDLLAYKLSSIVDADPARWVRRTFPQEEYLRETSKRKLFRVGNGGGKSFVSILDVLLRARKRHPYDLGWNSRRGSQRLLIVTVSWSQAVPLMRQLRSFLGDGELKKAPNWSESRGWGRDSPTLVFPDGTTIQWKTMDQGARRLAGSDYDFVLIDEPPKHEHYRELEQRVQRRGGYLSLAMTPINIPEDISWLRDMVSTGLILDMNYPMNLRLYTYTDGQPRVLIDGTICDEAWIKERIEATSPKWRDIVINGGWDEVTEDAVFSSIFSESRHILKALPGSQLTLSLGIDHGTKEFTETAVLIGVDEASKQAYILGTYEANANSPTEADAHGIIALLTRFSLKWADLDHVTGDIPHFGGRGTIGRKSNMQLKAEIRKALLLGRNEPLIPDIRTAKTGQGSDPKGSVRLGLEWVFRALRNDTIKILDLNNESMIKSFQKYKGGSTDPNGHLMDALRYALDPWIRRKRQL
jgi:hypothetical protein